MRYNIERACIEMSVRELCEMAYSGGDLDLRPGTGGGRPSFLRAVLGAKIHRRLQAAAGSNYQAEVTMTHTEGFHGLTFEVEGRADGVIAGDPYIVDEIKTVSGFAFSMPPAPIHFAQVKCYAHFLCRAKGLQRIQIRLTYYRVDDGEIRYIEEEQTADELAEFYADLLSRVEYRARILEERQTVLLPAIAGGRFPFSSVRAGQDDLIRACYRAINTSKRLFVDAPTGIGKPSPRSIPPCVLWERGSAKRSFTSPQKRQHAARHTRHPHSSLRRARATAPSCSRHASRSASIKKPKRTPQAFRAIAIRRTVRAHAHFTSAPPWQFAKF